MNDPLIIYAVWQNSYDTKWTNNQNSASWINQKRRVKYNVEDDDDEATFQVGSNLNGAHAPPEW